MALRFKKIFSTAISFIICFNTFSQSLNTEQFLGVAAEHLVKAQAYSNKASYPRSTNTDGTIRRVSPSDWTSGFFPGSLWLMFENTKDNVWRTRAEQWTTALESQKTNTTTHDLGFILYSSFGNGYRLTGNETYKAILLQGAQSLATRYNPVVKSIKSWDNKPPYTFPVIIDNMMNLEILFWATKVSGDSSYHKIAVQHALTTIANHFRPDNSSYHVVDYNPTNGNIISKGTYQGLNNLSDWARGQAWGLYGFTMCYRETGDTRFLDMAKKIADFYINHPAMPSDLITLWDFDATDYRDASAASIAASALMELSQYLSENREAYYNFGINILSTLSSATYTAAVSTNNNFILKHSVGNKPGNTEVDKPIIYADYFCIEALLRHKKPGPILTSVNGNGYVSLKWNTSTGARSYNIKRGVASGGPYTTIKSGNLTTNYSDASVTAGQTYYYVVTSANSSGEGASSAEVNGASTSQSQIYFSLSTVINGNGSIAKNPDQATYINGSTVILTASPAAGYQFAGWSGDATGSINPLSVTMNANKNITAGFSVAPAFITNIAGTSGRNYTLGQLIAGTKIYTDRTYQVTSAPASLINTPLIRTPNDDKNNTSNSTLSFVINQTATVYVAYDPRANQLPSWLSSWQKLTGLKIDVSDPTVKYMQLYSKVFLAGKVILGGNLTNPARGALSNYFVIVKAQAQQQSIVMRGDVANKFMTITNISNSNLQKRANAGSTFKIYPNPGTGQRFFIEANKFLKQEEINFTILDASGKIIESDKMKADNNGVLRRQVLLNRELAKGWYSVILKSGTTDMQEHVMVN